MKKPTRSTETQGDIQLTDSWRRYTEISELKLLKSIDPDESIPSMT